MVVVVVGGVCSTPPPTRIDSAPHTAESEGVSCSLCARCVAAGVVTGAAAAAADFIPFSPPSSPSSLLADVIGVAVGGGEGRACG